MIEDILARHDITPVQLLSVEQLPDYAQPPLVKPLEAEDTDFEEARARFGEKLQAYHETAQTSIQVTLETQVSKPALALRQAADAVLGTDLAGTYLTQARKRAESAEQGLLEERTRAAHTLLKEFVKDLQGFAATYRDRQERIVSYLEDLTHTRTVAERLTQELADEIADLDEQMRAAANPELLPDYQANVAVFGEEVYTQLPDTVPELRREIAERAAAIELLQSYASTQIPRHQERAKEALRAAQQATPALREIAWKAQDAYAATEGVILPAQDLKHIIDTFLEASSLAGELTGPVMDASIDDLRLASGRAEAERGLNYDHSP